jgi:hypothetical protein
MKQSHFWRKSHYYQHKKKILVNIATRYLLLNINVKIIKATKCQFEDIALNWFDKQHWQILLTFFLFVSFSFVFFFFYFSFLFFFFTFVFFTWDDKTRLHDCRYSETNFENFDWCHFLSKKTIYKIWLFCDCD